MNRTNTLRRLSLALPFLLLLSPLHPVQAQDNSGKRVRTGWSLGALPDVAYETDLGFKYGAIVNLFNYGDGSIYPNYYHTIYAEAARTTTNYNLFRLNYDSKYLIPNHRLNVDLTYTTDQLFDFYGFNGFEAVIHPVWTDPNDAAYISRAFYKLHGNMFRFAADLQGNIYGNVFWNAGLGILDYRISSVDTERLNRRKDDDERLPDTALLYDRYVSHGLISQAEKDGGFHPYLHAGISYDSRDRLQNPPHGIYADAFLSWFGAFGKLKDYNHLTANITWRQYFSLVPDRLTLAYRLGSQLSLAGHTPFYLNTYLNQLFLQRVTYEGLGGGNSVRGLLRHRINADGFAFANVELRLRLFDFHLGKENFYVGLTPFMDAGMVLQEHALDGSLYDDTDPLWQQNFDLLADLHSLHLAAGIGLKVAMNENFVLSVDWAHAIDPQDAFGNSLYVKVGYLF